LVDLFDELVEKIKLSNWKYEIKENQDSGNQLIHFEVPKERESEVLFISSGNKNLSQLIESNFEEFKFVKGFEAIWSSKYKKIECEMEIFYNNSQMMSNINAIVNNEVDIQKENEEDNDIDEEQKCGNKKEVDKIKLVTIKNIDILIGKTSKEFAVLSGLKSLMSTDIHFIERRTTIHIENINVNTHEEALNYLLKISNSLLFQLNNLLEWPTSLRYERLNRRTQIEERKKLEKNLNEDKQKKITSLRYEYDNEPMSLYIHAKNSFDSPLNQFLSYYQCIEFYFSVYANVEAKKKIQKLLKDPLFDPNLDHNITKILTIIKYNKSSEIGDERSQLETEIKSCVDQESLKDFIISSEKRKEFYEKNLGKKLSSQNINISGKNIDILHEISERIYDIRCRIVHKKANGDAGGLILPYSQEIKLLKYDIEIIEYIARNVLIVNSRPLNL
jgi:hypothetical protein